MRSSTALRLAVLVLAIAMTAPLLLPTLLRGLRPYIPPRASSLARTLIPFSNSLAITSTNSFQRFTSTSTANSNHNSNSNQPTATMASNLSFLDAVAHRRSIYTLNKSSPISDDRIEAIVSQLVKDVPSSFNSQSSRLVLLLKDEHDKFWDIVRDALKAIVPEDKWESTANRIGGFRAGYGTILFYESRDAVKALQDKIPLYADKFPEWSEHTSAMHQFAAWTALEAEGLGANLQHYNPLPDQKAAQIWDIPADWQLKAQLVFGGLQEGAREKLADKASEPIAGGRLFVHGKSA